MSRNPIIARRDAAIAALEALEADDFAPVLELVSDRCHVAGMELEIAHQSREPRRVWDRIGNALYTCARKCVS